MNLGIIGAGRWGTNYLKAFSELGVNAKWVCAADESSLKKAIEKANVKAQTTTDYRDILSDNEIEAVAIATPDSTHYRITKDSLEAGKHVLVEKPFTLNSREAEELVKLAGKRKKTLMVGHIHRFSPGIQKIKEGIDAGVFGKIRYVQTTATNNSPRKDTAVLWDFIPHDLTILPYLLGGYPESVSANGDKDKVTVDMKFNGVFATCFGSWVCPLRQRKLIVVGEKMSAFYDDYAKELKYHNETEQVIELSDALPLTEELKHLIDCVENNKKPLTDGEEGLKVVRVLEACQESIDNNGKAAKP